MVRHSFGYVNVYSFHSGCSDNVRHFKTEKGREMWKKMHLKKCEKCKEAMKNDNYYQDSVSTELNGFRGEDIRHHLSQQNNDNLFL